MEFSDTTRIPTIKDIKLGVDACPRCNSTLVPSTCQQRRKRKVPVGQLSQQQLLMLGRRPARGEVVEIEEITGELPVLACSNDDCEWSIPDGTQNQIVPPQPVIPELPICQLGHKRAWRLLQKVGHRVDL